jgi:hypothetical protein
VRHRLLHHACALHHLRQEHLAGAEQLAHLVHAGHQRAFDHVQRAAALRRDLLPADLGVGHDELVDAVHQRVSQPLLDGGCTPCQLDALVLGRALHALGHLEQPFGGVGAAVQHHVFDAFAQFSIELVVDADHPGVDDAHVHAGLDGVVQEHRVDRLAHRLVAAEAEAHVADAAGHLGPPQVPLDPARRVDEVDRIVGVLFDAGGDREDVGVEDDVLGREADLVDQDAIGALADLRLARQRVGLALLVERHHHRGRTVAADQSGLALELVDALLQRDRVDDALALDALEARFDHAPLRRVDHDRHARDLGLAGDQVQKAHHRGLAVEHGLVHVDVDDLSPVFHLLARHAERVFVAAVEHHARERLRPGDVGALADVDEQRCGVDRQGLEPRQLQGLDRGLGLNVGHRRPSAFGRRPAHHPRSLLAGVSAVAARMPPRGAASRPEPGGA